MHTLIETVNLEVSSRTLHGEPNYTGTASVILPDIQGKLDIPLSRTTIETIQEAVERDVDVALRGINP